MKNIFEIEFSEIPTTTPDKLVLDTLNLVTPITDFSIKVDRTTSRKTFTVTYEDYESYSKALAHESVQIGGSKIKITPLSYQSSPQHTALPVICELASQLEDSSNGETGEGCSTLSQSDENSLEAKLLL